jgi:hypothetical protein
MIKTTALAVALASLASPGPNQGLPPLELRSAALLLEYDATAGEAVVLFEGESEEALSGVEIRAPDGTAVLALRANARAGLAIEEFRISSQKAGLAELLQEFPTGEYRLRARSLAGATVQGAAPLAHALLAPPQILHPLDGATNVTNTGLSVSWTPDPGAARYRIVLEQDENDGLTVEISGGNGSFQVPSGVLAPGTRTRLEVGAIGSNGNCTSVEIRFRTL